MSTQHPPAADTAAETTEEAAVYGPPAPSRYRTVHLQRAKEEGRRFAMLTCYDAMTASLFDAAGIEAGLRAVATVPSDDPSDPEIGYYTAELRSLRAAMLPRGPYGAP